jgi:hypothetical protein
MWGIIPAAGTRSQLLVRSKQRSTIGARRENGPKRTYAVSEYIVERLIGCERRSKIFGKQALARTNLWPMPNELVYCSRS